MSTTKRRMAKAAALLALAGCAEPHFGASADDAGAIDPRVGTDDGGPVRISDPDARTALDDPTKVDATGQAARDGSAGAPGAVGDPGPRGATDGSAGTTLPVGDDAGAAQGTPPLQGPGTTPPASSLPGWAAPLEGTYAVHALAFSESQSVFVRWSTVWKLEITRSGDQLAAVVHTCAATATSQRGSDLGATDSAAKLPARRFEVVLGNDSFEVLPIDMAIGYDATPPPACEGHAGESVMKRTFQTWLSGQTCRCGSENPPKVDDCRVTDPDNDGRAGYSSSSHSFSDLTVWGANESHSALVQGQVDPEGAHTALYHDEDRLETFGCSPSPCLPSNTGAVCSMEHNRVSFARLLESAKPADGWNCAAIVQRMPELFPGTPAFPATCGP